MNKSMFMAILQHHLYALPAYERHELLAEYDMHFQHGMRNGQTEDEIAYELGDPIELAREALGEKYINPDLLPRETASTSRTIFALIGQFFLNISLTPVLLSLWAACLSLVVAAASLTLAPVLVTFEFMFNDYFSVGKIFLSIACLGLGLIAILYAVKLLRAWTLVLARYFKWIGRTLKGERNRYE
ncbi:DUF1700 domain-containing protein [Paenibacillus sp. N1-5-1-14]|uniref:DUF1700 domain-containing protein n=1 Tax=Paenibacillus radicibacter TaxID=2972488 RepID=UPI002158F627|nr:DUF1700 domain-containing protein [Paenibacillus radicibacter]MCR8642649.1 DUF1700 domain-containing protein [Paenibacillus radicibacter]